MPPCASNSCSKKPRDCASRIWAASKSTPAYGNRQADTEMTRSSITGQVKALSMIVAIQGLIPDYRAGRAKKVAARLRQRALLLISRPESYRNVDGSVYSPASVKKVWAACRVIPHPSSTAGTFSMSFSLR